MEAGLKEGKVIVHIGLPKTATTSLQMDFFPELENENVCYLGVHHPRTISNQSTIFESFVGSLSTGNVERVRAELFGLLSEGKTIIISEEMITVSLNNVSWRKKLDNLSKLLSGMNYLLLLTVREPVSAMFSYYVEIISHKQKIGKSFPEVAKFDERMEVFHYGKLASELIDHFDEHRILVIKFEDAVNGMVDGIAKIIVGETGSWEGVKLGKRNDKKQSKDYVYPGTKTTIADTLDSFLKIVKLKDISFLKRYKRIYQRIHGLLDDFVITKHSVQKPNVKQIDELKDFLSEENKKFSQLFNVYYE